MRIALLTAKPNRSTKVDGHKFYVGEKRPPHGIGFLYSNLNDKGFEVDIFDRYCGNTDWPSDNFSSYDFVGLYCATVCSDDIKKVIKKTKAKRIAVGGPHAYLFPDTFPKKVTHIVRGEAESIIVDLAKGNISDRIVVPPRLSDTELDNLPRFPWDLFYNHYRQYYDWGFHFHEVKPVFTMNTSRGCPFACSFCSVKQVWGRRLTAMSAERVFDDMKYVATLGAKAVYFREDNFTARNKRLRALCEMLIESESKLLWACETRVDTVGDELMGLMKRAGCIGLYIGVESLSQNMLDIFQKQVTVDEILSFFESANKYGLFTHASFVTNHPKETDEDRQATERLLNVIKPSLVVMNEYRKNG